MTLRWGCWSDDLNFKPFHCLDIRVGFLENISNFAVSAVPADDFAPLGAVESASVTTTKLWVEQRFKPQRNTTKHRKYGYLLGYIVHV